ncbi:MAG: BatD family protein [Candidatus Omnitrophota bacterium]
MWKLSKIFILVLGVFLCLGFWGQDSKKRENTGSRSVKVEVSKDKVKTGETFSYLITIEGEFSDPSLQLPDFDNFRIISTKKSKNFSYQKDKINAKIKITYFLLCPEPGSFTIKPVKITDNNKTYKSNSVKITATGESLEGKKELQPYIEGGTKI